MEGFIRDDHATIEGGSQPYYQYGNFDDYPMGNITKCRDVITGTVILPITVPVIFRSVMMSLLVRYLADYRTGNLSKSGLIKRT